MHSHVLLFKTMGLPTPTPKCPPLPMRANKIRFGYFLFIITDVPPQIPRSQTTLEFNFSFFKQDFRIKERQFEVVTLIYASKWIERIQNSFKMLFESEISHRISKKYATRQKKQNTKIY